MAEERRQNESLRLFEMGVDDEFKTKKAVFLDSSLGLVPQPAGRGKTATTRKH